MQVFFFFFFVVVVVIAPGARWLRAPTRDPSPSFVSGRRGHFEGRNVVRAERVERAN